MKKHSRTILQSSFFHFRQYTLLVIFLTIHFLCITRGSVSCVSLGGLLEVGDQVVPVLLLPQPGEDHLRAGNELARLLQILVQSLSTPNDALVLVGLGH